jgi:hypothetical protein
LRFSGYNRLEGYLSKCDVAGELEKRFEGFDE